MVAIAVGILFYAKNNSMIKIQSLIGAYLYQEGATDALKQQLNRLGVSIGVNGIHAMTESFALAQQVKLKSAGKHIRIRLFHVVWDNLNLYMRVEKGRERLDSQNIMLNATSGFIQESIVKPEQHLPLRSSFHPERIKKLDGRHLLPFGDKKFYRDVMPYLTGL